jgi:hypothetical protein
MVAGPERGVRVGGAESAVMVGMNGRNGASSGGRTRSQPASSKQPIKKRKTNCLFMGIHNYHTGLTVTDSLQF